MTDEKNEKPANDEHKQHDEHEVVTQGRSVMRQLRDSVTLQSKPEVVSKDEKHEPKPAEVVTKDEKPSDAKPVSVLNELVIKPVVQTTGYMAPVTTPSAAAGAQPVRMAPSQPQLTVVPKSTPAPPLKPAPYAPAPAKSAFSVRTTIAIGAAVGTVAYAILHFALHII